MYNPQLDLILRGVGVIESPLLERNIFADK